MIFDVVIIGGGVVGTLTARELSKYNLSVCVLEKTLDVANGATKANSAIVHGGFDPEEGTLKAKLNVKGNALMESLCRDLQVPYRKNGSLVLAFDENQMKTVEMLYHRGIANGVPDLRILNVADVHEKEPALTDEVVGALFSPSAGIVCPYQLCIAAMGNAMDNGALLKTDFEVKSITKNGEAFVLSNGAETVDAKYVVNCAGMYSDQIAAMIGDKQYRLTPKKGEYMLLDKSVGDLVSCTVFQTPTEAGKGVLVTPTVDGNLLVGPTADFVDSREDKDTTMMGLDKIKTLASKSVKNIPFKKVITSFAGLRASLGGDFVIEASKREPCFIHTVGIDSPGLSSAPAIALTVVDLLKEAGLCLTENKSFNGTRRTHHGFMKLSLAERNAVIRENPAFGRIVCRCESVTEGEIVEAIHQNPKAVTLDAVKRRTRSRMGRCQGGFCTTYLTEILARELGITEEEVAQKSKQSFVLEGGDGQ